MCKIILSILLLLLPMVIGGLASAQAEGHTVVTMQVDAVAEIEPPKSFDFGVLEAGNTYGHDGASNTYANFDWMVEVEDNSNFFVPPVGPGTGHMTKTPYVPPPYVQLDKPMYVTMDGTTVNMAEAPGGSPKLIKTGSPGVILGIPTSFSQEITYKDLPGTYEFVTTFLISKNV